MQDHTKSVLWACSQRTLFVWSYTAPAVQRESVSFWAGMGCSCGNKGGIICLLLPPKVKRWNLKKWNLWEAVFPFLLLCDRRYWALNLFHSLRRLPWVGLKNLRKRWSNHRFLRNSGRGTWICKDKFQIEKSFCICYNANRQKEITSPCGQEWIPKPCCSTVWGFFFSFIVAKHPLG